jgi:hypothetical protein
MVREDIIYGLKNAMSRGQGLEQAMRSFISAGYDLNEVQEAANSLNMGPTINLPQTESKKQEENTQAPTNLYSQKQTAQQTNETSMNDQQTTQPNYEQQNGVKYQPLPQAQFNIESQKPKKKIPKILIFLIILLLLLIGGITFMSFFGEEILNLIFK